MYIQIRRFPWFCWWKELAVLQKVCECWTSCTEEGRRSTATSTLRFVEVSRRDRVAESQPLGAQPQAGRRTRRMACSAAAAAVTPRAQPQHGQLFEYRLSESTRERTLHPTASHPDSPFLRASATAAPNVDGKFEVAPPFELKINSERLSLAFSSPQFTLQQVAKRQRLRACTKPLQCTDKACRGRQPSCTLSCML